MKNWKRAPRKREDRVPFFTIVKVSEQEQRRSFGGT